MTEEEVKLLKEMQNNCKNESNYYTDPKAESKAKAIESALKLQQRIDKAIEIAYQYAQIDGGHHKMWTIDQIVRELLGDEYDKFIKEYEEDGEYIWDTGIAP